MGLAMIMSSMTVLMILIIPVRLAVLMTSVTIIKLRTRMKMVRLTMGIMIRKDHDFKVDNMNNI